MSRSVLDFARAFAEQAGLSVRFDKTIAPGSVRVISHASAVAPRGVYVHPDAAQHAMGGKAFPQYPAPRTEVV